MSGLLKKALPGGAFFLSCVLFNAKDVVNEWFGDTVTWGDWAKKSTRSGEWFGIIPFIGGS